MALDFARTAVRDTTHIMHSQDRRTCTTSPAIRVALKRLTQEASATWPTAASRPRPLRVDASDLLRDGAPIGRFLDAYVATQIRPEIAVSPRTPGLYHLRDRDGHEVDLLLDYGRAGLLALEVKASAAPTTNDAGPIRWLMERLPTLRAGIVLHTGPSTYHLADHIIAAPIATLWA